MTKASPMIIACLLAGALICQTAVASSPPEKDSRFTQKIKASLLELGTGDATRVTVKLKDKTELTGYIKRGRRQVFRYCRSSDGHRHDCALS